MAGETEEDQEVLITTSFLVRVSAQDEIAERRIHDAIEHLKAVLNEGTTLRHGESNLVPLMSFDIRWLEDLETNAEKCGRCGRWTTDRTKAHSLPGLLDGTEHPNGQLFCFECQLMESGMLPSPEEP